MDQLLLCLNEIENEAVTKKINELISYIYDEEYESDSIKMDIGDGLKGNIENIIDDESIIESMKNFIHFHSGFVVYIIFMMHVFIF